MKEHRFLKDETLEMIRKRGYAHAAEVVLLLQDLIAYKKKVKELEKSKGAVEQ